MTDTDLVTRTAIYTLATPVIVALIQLIKTMLPEALHKYAPLAAVLFGLIVAFGALSAVPEPPQPWIVTLLLGVGNGLAASGLYSGGRALAGPARVEPEARR